MRTKPRIMTAFFIGAVAIPALWAVGPDYMVTFDFGPYGATSPPPGAEDAPGGKKRVARVNFVSNPSIPPAERREVNMSLEAYLVSGPNVTETEVCSTKTKKKITQTMTFTLFYPALRPRAPLPVKKNSTYRIQAHIMDPIHMGADADPNYLNNLKSVTFTVPAGGTPSCVLVE